jgi:hypothetical protein
MVEVAYFVVDLVRIAYPYEAFFLEDYANDSPLRLLDQATAYRRFWSVGHVTCAIHDRRVR